MRMGFIEPVIEEKAIAGAVGRSPRLAAAPERRSDCEAFSVGDSTDVGTQTDMIHISGPAELAAARAAAAQHQGERQELAEAREHVAKLAAEALSEEPAAEELSAAAAELSPAATGTGPRVAIPTGSPCRCRTPPAISTARCAPLAAAPWLGHLAQARSPLAPHGAKRATRRVP